MPPSFTEGQTHSLTRYKRLAPITWRWQLLCCAICVQNFLVGLFTGYSSFESLLDCKEIKPVDPKGNLCWIFSGRTEAEVEAPILWPPDARSTHWKIPWLKAKGEGATENKMVGWHYWLNRLEFEQTPGDSGGRGVRHAAVHSVTMSWRSLSDWTTITTPSKTICVA